MLLTKEVEMTWTHANKKDILLKKDIVLQNIMISSCVGLKI